MWMVQFRDDDDERKRMTKTQATRYGFSNVNFPLFFIVWWILRILSVLSLFNKQKIYIYKFRVWVLCSFKMTADDRRNWEGRGDSKALFYDTKSNHHIFLRHTRNYLHIKFFLSDDVIGSSFVLLTLQQHHFHPFSRLFSFDVIPKTKET